MMMLGRHNVSRSGTQLLPVPRPQPRHALASLGRGIIVRPCVAVGGGAVDQRAPDRRVNITGGRDARSARAGMQVVDLDAIESVEAQSIVETSAQHVAARPPLSSPPAPLPPPPTQTLRPATVARLAPTLPSLPPLPALPDDDPFAATPTQKAECPRILGKAARSARHGIVADVAARSQPRPVAWLPIVGPLVAALFAGAALTEVDVTVEAPGALRAPNGLRSVESVLPGAVSHVLTRVGDGVEAGQVMVRLADAQLRSSLVLEERRLEVLRRETEEASRADEEQLALALRASRRQRATLLERRSIHQKILRSRQERLANVQVRVDFGLDRPDDARVVDEAVQAATEQVALFDYQLTEVELAQVDRVRDMRARDLERRAMLSRQSAGVEEARSLLSSTAIRAPTSGRVESLFTQVGEVIDPGQVIAQIAPKNVPRAIVAFLPSREAPFISVGSDASVEVESLAAKQPGVTRARVTRVSSDIAPLEEIRSTLGESLCASRVRVELELLDDAADERTAPRLRSGERVFVRWHRRQRRLLGLAFDLVRQ
jgi:multidrug efflux pump subunit AcrA (membrane-fusion protein)